MERKRLSGLLPIGVFLIVYLGSGILLQDFYAMPATVAFAIALIVGFLQNPKKKFNEKIECVTKSMGSENVMMMCLIFLLAGAFSGTVQAAGGAESTVNFALTYLPAKVCIVGLFFIGCFISVAMGTSVGTIVALCPIAAGISEKTGFSPALCIAAVVCGAMFGDNLSMISDTTIAATKTQGCEMKDKFKENFFIVLPAAIITAVLFFILGFHADYQLSEELPYRLVQIIPYLVVFFGAILGGNVFVILTLGTLMSVVAGLVTGTIAGNEIFTIIGDGFSNMFEIIIISLLVAGMIGLIKENGGIDYLLYKIKTGIRSKKGAQAGIAVLASVVDIATANNTIAIVMAGPIVKDIAEEFDITPKRAAALLDIFTSVWQGILPYGAQLLYASAGAMSAGIVLSPVEIIPYLFYPFLMAVCAVIAILMTKSA